MEESQVALNNIRMQAALGQMTADEAQELIEQINRRMKEKIEAARREAEARIAEAERRARRRLDEQLKLLRQQAEQPQAEIVLAPWPDVRRLRRGLESRLESFELAVPPELARLVDLQPALLHRLGLGAIEVTRQQKAELARVRRQQAQRLWQALATLRKTIYDETRAAAEAVCMAHGYLVLVPPTEPAKGPDLTAQCEAWLSVWEVVDVEPGESITLEDQLTGEIRRVRDGTASRSLIVRDTVLARVIGLSDEYYFSGLHPRPLPPLEAAEVVRLARQRLRRRRTVPVDRVRAGEFGRYLIRKWEDQVERMELARSIPPQLSNTDGDPLLLTRDHFEFEAADRRRVADILMGMEDVLPPENNSGDQEFVFLQQGTEPDLQNTIIGMAMLKRSSLRLTTNSVARADALRSRVQKACGDLIRHQLREHSDPMSLGARKPSLPDSSFLDTEETRALTLDFKRRHYATWPDQPLPALKGRTPRQAVRTAQGRRDVEVLIKDLENHEARFEGENAFDFSDLRRELGLG